MTTLAEELTILIVGLQPKAGPATVDPKGRFRFALRGAELVSLSLAGRVEVQGERIVVRSAAPVGDESVDFLLTQLAASGGAQVKDWFRLTPANLVDYYFNRLEAAGAMRSEPVRFLLFFKLPGFQLLDQGIYHRVWANLDAAVRAPGPLDAAQSALAGLVYAAGWAPIAYPGDQNAPLRDRLARLAGGDPATAAATAAPVTDQPWIPQNFQDPNLLTHYNLGTPTSAANNAATAAAAQATANAAGHAAAQAAAQAATHAATHAAVHAATHAAVTASIDAAVHAATSAATTHEVSHHSSSSGSSDSSSTPSHHH